MKVKTELIGVPSGQVIEIYSVFIPTLHNYGYIMFDPKLNYWIFYDDMEMKIKTILNRNDICMF